MRAETQVTSCRFGKFALNFVAFKIWKFCFNP